MQSEEQAREQSICQLLPGPWTSRTFTSASRGWFPAPQVGANAKQFTSGESMQRILFVLSVVIFGLVMAGPVSAATQSGPVTCVDGTTSPHGGKGACSGHGGIKKAEAAKEKEKPATEKPAKDTKKTSKSKKKAEATEAPAAAPATQAAPAPAAAPSRAKPAKTETTGSKASGNTDPSGATARCKDGTYSHAKTHQGACSRHGGVAEWLDGSGKK